MRLIPIVRASHKGLGTAIAAGVLPLVGPGPVRAQIVTHHDTIPDFCAGPTLRSSASGSWSNAATWTPGGTPGSGDIVLVSAGTTVTFDAVMGAPAACSTTRPEVNGIACPIPPETTVPANQPVAQTNFVP